MVFHIVQVQSLQEEIERLSIEIEYVDQEWKKDARYFQEKISELQKNIENNHLLIEAVDSSSNTIIFPSEKTEFDPEQSL